MKNLCDKCTCYCKERLLNIYGELLCEDCWDTYMRTPESKVEYLVGIANEDYSAIDLGINLIYFAMFQWHKNKDQFDISDDEITRIENYVKFLNLF